jgi:hypothetical protein
MSKDTTPLNGWKKQNEIWTTSGTLAKLGITARQAKNITKRMAKRHGVNSFPKSLHAPTAPKRLCQRLFGTINFVPGLVARLIGAKAGSMTRPGSALSADRSSAPTSIQEMSAAQKAVLVKKCGVSKRVYDLSVDMDNEFFVGGILVHNSVDSVIYSLDDEINATGPAKMENISGR